MLPLLPPMSTSAGSLTGSETARIGGPGALGVTTLAQVLLSIFPSTPSFKTDEAGDLVYTGFSREHLSPL